MLYWIEWMVLIWLSGRMLSELTNRSRFKGLGGISKLSILILNLIAVGLHTSCFFVDQSNWGLLIYVRNLFSGLSVFMCCVQILDFLAFHRIFGPWTIIFSDLMGDLAKFATILMIFMFGFNMVVLAMNQPYFALTEMSGSIEQTQEVLDKNAGDFSV